MKPARVGSSLSVSSHITFMQSLSAMQVDSQRRQFVHEQKLLLQLLEFEERRKQERKKYDTEMRKKENGAAESGFPDAAATTITSISSSAVSSPVF